MSGDWWDLVPAAFGAVLGALAAGVPAWFLAKQSAKEVLARDSAARKDHERALAYRVMVKLLIIVNSTHELHSYIESAIKAADENGHEKLEMWQKVQPLIGFSNEGSVQFDADEAGLFMAAKQSQFLNELLLLGRRHSTLISLFREYATKRDALRAVLPAPHSFDGNVGSSLLTKEQHNRALMHTMPVAGLIAGLRESCATDWKTAQKISGQFGPMMREYFGDPTFPLFDLSKATVIQASEDLS